MHSIPQLFLWIAGIAVVVGTDCAIRSLEDFKFFTFADFHVWWNTGAVVSQNDSLETTIGTAIGLEEGCDWPLMNGIERVIWWKTVEDEVTCANSSGTVSGDISTRPLPDFRMEVLVDVAWVDTDPVIDEGVLRRVVKIEGHLNVLATGI